MKNKKYLFVGLLFLVLNSYSQKLSLKDYVSIVKDRNLILEDNKYHTKIAKLKTSIAKSYLLPTIEFEANYQRDLRKNYLYLNDSDGNKIRFKTNFNNSISASLLLEQTVFNPTIFSALKMSKLNEEIQELQHLKLIDEIESNATVLYWQTVFSKESIKVLQENVELAKDRFEQVNNSFSKGLVSELQLLEANILYKKTIPILRKSKKEYENLMRNLKKLARIPSSDSIILIDSLKMISLKNGQNKFNNNLKIRILEKELEISKREVKSKQNFWLPKLNLTVNYNYSAQNDRFSFKDNKNNLLYAQLGIRIPLFSGGRNKFGIQKAKAEERALTIKIKEQKEALTLELKNTQENYLAAIRNINLHKSIIELSKKEFNIKEKQFSMGVLTNLDFKENRLRLMQSKLELLSSYLSANIAKYKMDKITNNSKNNNEL